MRRKCWMRKGCRTVNDHAPGTRPPARTKAAHLRLRSYQPGAGSETGHPPGGFRHGPAHSAAAFPLSGTESADADASGNRREAPPPGLLAKPILPTVLPTLGASSI